MRVTQIPKIELMQSEIAKMKSHIVSGRALNSILLFKFDTLCLFFSPTTVIG